MAKDKYHELVKQALEEDGWTITHDPLVVPSLIADPVQLSKKNGVRLIVYSIENRNIQSWKK